VLWRIKLTRKPSADEFSVISKVSGAGILLVGFIGFAIYILISVIPGWFIP
jgi:protein transport protein SEC61 subunit gamma and related proteins